MATTHTDTIVAVSSPPGRSWRGMIRLTGPDTPALLQSVLGQVPPARQLTPLKLALPVETISLSPRERAGVRLPSLPLPVLLAYFPAPRSYTGQATAELQLPGHPALLERILHLFLQHGARLAEPGEFTFRAFLHGKLDLTQAEGVAAAIAATSQSQLHAARHLRTGELGRFASDLVDSLASILALVEAGIDFTDQEDVVPIPPAELLLRINSLQDRLRELLDHSRSWREILALPRVVLAGPPSVGKSSLFNTLLGHQRAVTSPLPGTTRDLLAEPLTLRLSPSRQVEVMLIDIAGLDSPQALLDQQIQSIARDAMASADLLLWLSPDGAPPALPPGSPPLPPCLRLRAKADLPCAAPLQPDEIPVSTITLQGVTELRLAIAAQLGTQGVPLAGEILTLQPRHQAALQSATQALAQASALSQAAQPHLPHPELIANELRQALDQLAGLGGQLTPDDVLGRIFAGFCIGK